jgi:hypothetical protein
VLALFYPDHEINFLLLFLFPVTVRPKYVIAALLLINLFLLGTYEIPGRSVFLDYSPAAHLGGMLAGWIYFRYFHANNGWDRASSLELPGWLHRSEKAGDSARHPVPKSAISSAELRAQADLILDKINSHGFGALTDDEKRLLDEAKDLLSRS